MLSFVSFPDASNAFREGTRTRLPEVLVVVLAWADFLMSVSICISQGGAMSMICANLQLDAFPD